MTELRKLLDSLASDAGEYSIEQIDWASSEWSAARPALAWLGLVSEPPSMSVIGTLSAGDASAICDAMMTRFRHDETLAWSSYMLTTAARAVSLGVGGVPEVLLRSAWQFLSDYPLDENVFEFCHALGTQMLSEFRSPGDWDLRWSIQPGAPSQLCLRYWILALRPELWTAEVEEATLEVLRKYPHPF